MLPRSQRRIAWGFATSREWQILPAVATANGKHKV